jgi:hypothetical protein
MLGVGCRCKDYWNTRSMVVKRGRKKEETVGNARLVLGGEV